MALTRLIIYSFIYLLRIVWLTVLPAARIWTPCRLLTWHYKYNFENSSLMCWLPHDVFHQHRRDPVLLNRVPQTELLHYRRKSRSGSVFRLMFRLNDNLCMTFENRRSSQRACDWRNVCQSMDCYRLTIRDNIQKQLPASSFCFLLCVVCFNLESLFICMFFLDRFLSLFIY